MKKNRKSVVALLAALIVVGATVWANVRLNRTLDAAYGVREEFYAMGELIPFGDNTQSMNGTADGYSVSVDRAEVLTYEELLEKVGRSEDSIEELMGANAASFPEKVLLVSLTICNADSDEKGVVLDGVGCYGENYDLNADITLTIVANDFLFERYESELASYYGELGITIDPGNAVSVYVVYDFYEGYFSRTHWNDLESESLWVNVTWNPVKKIVPLTISIS